MRRLSALRPVLLRSGVARVHARTVAVQGDTALLLPTPGAFLPRSETEGRLEFEHAGHVVALSGAIEDGPFSGLVSFTAVGGGMAQRRAAPRLAVDLPVTVHGDDGPVPARTIDFAQGGVLLVGWTAVVGAAATVVLQLPGSGEPVSLTGRVVRTTPQGTALAFDEGQEATRATLGELVLGVWRMAAEREAERERKARDEPSRRGASERVA